MPLTSYIMKTTRNTVEYMRIISGKQDKATINFDLNFNSDDFAGRYNSPSKLSKGVVKNYLYQVLKPLTVGNMQEALNMFRFTLATYVEVISILRSKIF